ncbi:MAG: hypothetical protein KC933_19495 [Myxococcales bacterium]|nr:hypothetical protein [Myxococcales bacterium]
MSVKLDKLTKALREAIDELRAEQASIDAKIRALAESAKALGGAVGRGRKAAAAGEGGAPGRKKPKWSPEARAAAAERARLRWAKQKKTTAQGAGAAPKKATKKKATKKKATKKKVAKKAPAKKPAVATKATKKKVTARKTSTAKKVPAAE